MNDASDHKAQAEMMEQFQKSLRLAQTMATKHLEKVTKNTQLPYQDPLSLQTAMQQWMEAAGKNPMPLMEQSMAMWQQWAQVNMAFVGKALGVDNMGQEVKPPRGDRRFKAKEWEENIAFDYIKQMYLLASDCIMQGVNGIQGLDEHESKKLGFHVQQYVDALSPTNFASTNPDVLKATVESKGENLRSGFEAFLSDLERGGGERLATQMTDTSVFELGVNVASTPGSVVMQNRMMQLLQYQPSTEKVHKRPVLIVPPWINKFYILDLQPKNSMIKWLVDQGHTVFVISWVNPDASYADTSFEDYMNEGILAALDGIEAATGEKQANAIGYCLGGTLLSATTAYLKATKKNRLASATFMTTLIDFTQPGDLGNFIDEAQVSAIEKSMQEDGYLDGSSMATAFNMLRSNDLIWPFFINNYLMGKKPKAFDLLYWNSDSTRLPAAMHSFYLRKMYLENRLAQPEGLSLNGVPINLADVDTPVYFISTKDDHIAPWKSTFIGAGLFAGDVRFVLGGSGHIAGIVNPPEANKYGYRTGGAPEGDADQWAANTEAHEGSWWVDWSKWVSKFNGTKVNAREPGSGKLDVIEAAPGSYVKHRIT